MKAGISVLFTTALAPAIWGSTYIVTTEYLRGFSPMTVALLRALPAGLLLLLLVRELPVGAWWIKVCVLGALNFSLFLSMLFIAAYRLPGGVAATLGATQPLLVVVLARLILGRPLQLLSFVAALVGAAGVALLVFTPGAVLDPVGVIAGLVGAGSMALGTVLNRKWQPPVSLLTFTAWQLTAGGLLLLPVVLVFEPPMPVPGIDNLLALGWLGLVGMGLAYVVWLRGIVRLDAALVSSLGLLSPLMAVLLGWIFLDQSLDGFQMAGALAIVASIGLIQHVSRGVAPPVQRLTAAGG